MFMSEEMKMKQEVRLLRKAQKIAWDNMYPGYPFSMTIIIDLEDKSAYVNWCGKKISLSRALEQVYSKLIYQCLGANNTSKKSFLVDQHLEDYQTYLKCNEEDFWFNNLNAVRFYFALNSAIFNHKKTDKGYVFGIIDDDCDYVDVRVFNDLKDIQAYVDNYFWSE